MDKYAPQVLVAAYQHWVDALYELDQRLARNPRNTQALLLKVEALRKLQRHEEALQTNALILHIDPTNASVWADRGWELRQLRRDEECITACDRALQLDPARVTAWCNKAYVLVRLGRAEEGLAASERAIALNPSFDAWGNKCEALFALGHSAEARAAFEHAITFEVQSASMWADRAITLNFLGRYAEAIEACERALGLEPTTASAWGTKGNALSHMKRYSEALICYQHLCEFAEQIWIGLNGTAAILVRLGQNEEALPLIDRALALTPLAPLEIPLWITRGGAQFQMGHYEEALADLDHARYRLDALGAAARTTRMIHSAATMWTYIGKTMTKLARYEEALEAFHQATLLDPERAEAWSSFGDLLVALERYEEALTVLDHALALDVEPEEASTWEAKARAFHALGRDAEATAAKAAATSLARAAHRGR